MSPHFIGTVLAGTLVSWGDATVGHGPAREPAWTMTSIDLSLTVDTGRRALHGSGEIVLVLTEGSTPRLVLELGPTGRFDAVAVVGAVTSLGATARTAEVTWDTPRTRGDTVRATVRFAHADRASQLVVDPSGALASWVTGWYPSPEGETSRVPGTIRYLIPEGWDVLSNGAPGPPRSSDGRTIRTWTSSAPVDWSFSAADYQVDSVVVAGSGTARVYTLAGSGRQAVGRSYAEQAGAVLAALRPVFGPYPYPGYGVAEIAPGLVTWGGSSEQGFFMSPALGERVNLPLLAHELAHGWWGNAVRPTGPATLLLTESLAQLGAALAIEAIEGAESARDFLRFSRDGYNSRQSARGYFTLARLGHDKPLATLDGTGQDHNLSDAKGHWVFLMLRDRLGAARFGEFLQGVIRTHRDSALSLVALRRMAVMASEDSVRMHRFLAEWLDRPGAPELSLDWRPASAGRILVTIRQHGPIYDLDVPIRLDLPGESRVEVVRSVERETTVEFRVPAPPRAVLLDPEYRLLRWDPDYGPRLGLTLP